MRCFLFFVMLLTTTSSYSQEKLAFKPVRDANLTQLLNNLREYKKFEGSELAIRIYLASGQKSAGGPESDEVSDNLYIAVSEFDEAPKQVLYQLFDVFSVSDITISSSTEHQKIVLSFSYFDRKIKQKKKVVADVGLNGVTLKIE